MNTYLVYSTTDCGILFQSLNAISKIVLVVIHDVAIHGTSYSTFRLSCLCIESLLIKWEMDSGWWQSTKELCQVKCNTNIYMARIKVNQIWIWNLHCVSTWLVPSVIELHASCKLNEHLMGIYDLRDTIWIITRKERRAINWVRITVALLNF